MRTHGEHLHRMLSMFPWGLTGQEEALEAVFDKLARIAPETMTQQQCARRWPRVLAAMIVESGGYFTPESAANAVIRYKSGDSFGCEYYCMLAGFERSGWPHNHKEYRAKLRTAQRRQMIAATQCVCFRYEHRFGRHAHSGSRSVGNPGTRELALELVKRLAETGSSRVLMASWF